MGFGVWGLGFGVVWGLGFGVWGFGALCLGSEALKPRSPRALKLNPEP